MPSDIEKARNWLNKEWHFIGNETETEKEKLNTMFEGVVKWLASILSGLEPYWLVLVGPSGVGKTLLARRAAKYLSDYGLSVFNKTIKVNDKDAILSYMQYGSIFAPWRELVPHNSGNQERYENAGRDLWKVIDDLKPQTGEEVIIEGEPGVKPKRFEINAAGDLLDRRLRKSSLITSNLTRSQLALFWDVRIASRLTRDGGTIIETLDVTDYALRKEAYDRSLENL